MNVFSSLLLVAIIFPAAAALFIGRGCRSSARTAIFASVVSLAAAALFNLRFELLLDGLSVWPFIFTSLTVPAAVIIGRRGISDNLADAQRGGETAYYRLLLIFESGLLALFAAGDAMLFFVFYGFSLLPFFFLAAADFSARRRAAARFFSIEAGGCQLVLLGLLAGAVWECPSSLPIFIVLTAGFTIRIASPPLFAFFTTTSRRPAKKSAAAIDWLPAILLAASGVYGVLRFARPLLPQADFSVAPWLWSLAAAAAFSAALAAVARASEA